MFLWLRNSHAAAQETFAGVVAAHSFERNVVMAASIQIQARGFLGFPVSIHTQDRREEVQFFVFKRMAVPPPDKTGDLRSREHDHLRSTKICAETGMQSGFDDFI